MVEITFEVVNHALEASMEATVVSLFDGFNDIVVAIAAAVVAVATWKASVAARAGLSSWRDEAVWREDRDLARNLFRACLQMRDEFVKCRDSFVTYPEERRTKVTEWGMTDEDLRRAEKKAGYASVYDARIKSFGQSLVELRASAREAGIVWTEDLDSRIDEVRACGAKLIANLYLHLEYIGDGSKVSEGSKESEDEMKEVIRDHKHGGPFTERIDAAIDSIKNVAESHLARPGQRAKAGPG